MKETEIGEAVAAEFRAEGWDVFCEVGTGANNPICDLVARRGSLLWAVECKTTRSIDVLDQAAQWLGCAHLVSVAVPSRSRVRHRIGRMDGWSQLAEYRGIGVFGVGSYGSAKLEVRRLTLPRVNRAIRLDWLSKSLVDAQRSSVAGAAGGGHWTPFRNTCDQLRRIAAAEPGIRLRDAVGRIEHHYGKTSTACSALSKWIHAGTVKGVRISAGKLYPAAEISNATEHLGAQEDA